MYDFELVVQNRDSMNAFLTNYFPSQMSGIHNISGILVDNNKTDERVMAAVQTSKW
jgi:hypothetical protein